LLIPSPLRVYPAISIELRHLISSVIPRNFSAGPLLFFQSSEAGGAPAVPSPQKILPSPRRFSENALYDVPGYPLNSAAILAVPV